HRTVAAAGAAAHAGSVLRSIASGGCDLGRIRLLGSSMKDGARALPISRLGSLNPLVECLFTDNPDSDRHEGMVLAAKLRALPVIHPGLLGLEPSCRNATGDSVHLGSERRNGPAVDHVVRRDEHMDDL